MNAPSPGQNRAQPVALTCFEVSEASESERKTPLQFKTFRRLFRYTNRQARRRNILIALVIVRAFQLPLLAWGAAAVISGPIARGDWRGVLLATLGFAAFAVFTQVTFHFRIRTAMLLGESVIHDLRNDLYAHLQTLTASFYNKTKIGRIISRLTSDVDAVRMGVQDIAFVSAVQGGQMIISGILMAYYDWVLFSVMLVMAPVIWALNRHFNARMANAQRRAQESFSRVTATLAESVTGIRVTQGFVRQDVNAGFFRDLVTDHSRYSMDAARTSAIFLPLLELNSQFFIAVLLLLGGYRVLSPDIHTSVGNIVQFFFLANMFFDPIRVIGMQYTQALSAVVGAERVFRLLDTQPDWTDPPDAAPIPNMRGEVEFRNLTFAYEPDTPVLKNISFTAKPGQTIALVGHTGSGKSSIINLVSKMYLPTSGQLLIDGHDITWVQSESLHRQMGVVHQVNFLFEGSVMENIRFGRPDATDEEVIDATRCLNYLDLIEDLPGGFSTAVGENGSGLSLGQRQLVCISRALLADPRILIFDEATSSIDSKTESRIQESLKTLLEGRTSFVVAHRLSTVREADLILVLDHGRIVERGTHAELLGRKGIYQGLYEQFVQSVRAS